MFRCDGRDSDHVRQRRLAVSSDDGAVLVWVALMSVWLIGFAALAVDLGYAYAVQRQLSFTADASALAGAQEAGRNFKDRQSTVVIRPSMA